MITARIFRDSEDENGALVQFFALPQTGQSISMPDEAGTERDLKVLGLNHLVKRINGHLQQVEVVIFCEPTTTLIQTMKGIKKPHFCKPQSRFQFNDSSGR